MRIRNSLVSFLVAFTLSAQSLAQGYTSVNSDVVSSSLSTIASDFSQGTSIRYDLIDDSEKPIMDSVRELSEGAHKTIILSSSVDGILRDGIKIASDANRDGDRFFIVPLGDAVRDLSRFPSDDETKKTDKSFNGIFKMISERTSKISGSDKFGVMVMTIALGTEVFMWAHADKYIGLEKGAGIAFALASGIFFGINKDAWTNATKPIQKGIRKVFRMRPEKENDRTYANLAVKVFASAGLALLINEVRVPFLNIDEIANETFKFSEVTKAAAISVGSAFAVTSWLEALTSIELRTHPKAKFTSRRIIEARSLLMSAVAGGAMLNEFSKYGYAPWIVLGISGIAGTMVYRKSDLIKEWMENSDKIEKMFHYAKSLAVGSGLRKWCVSTLKN